MVEGRVGAESVLVNAKRFYGHSLETLEVLQPKHARCVE